MMVVNSIVHAKLQNLKHFKFRILCLIMTPIHIDEKILKKFAKERTMIFVDGPNLFHSATRFRKGLRIDALKLIKPLSIERKVVKTFYYINIDPESAEQQRFVTALQERDIEVKKKEIRKTKWGKMEKGLDVLLATDILWEAFQDTFDTAILVSGDEDYASAIFKVKGLGKKVEVACFKCAIGKLKLYCDEFVSLDELANQIEL